MANSQALGTYFSPARDVMSRHEALNTAVDMNSWAVSTACYPRSTFYPLSDGPLPFRTTDHYDLLHLLAPSRRVKLAYAIALTS